MSESRIPLYIYNPYIRNNNNETYYNNTILFFLKVEKSWLRGEMLKAVKTMIHPIPERIIYAYGEWEDIFEEMIETGTELPEVPIE